MLPAFYAFGFAVAASNRQHLRLGDLAADTLVVHLDRRGGPVQAILDAESDMGASRSSANGSTSSTAGNGKRCLTCASAGTNSASPSAPVSFGQPRSSCRSAST